MKSTNPIAALFGRSPFKPTQEHMRLVQDCVSRLSSMTEALIARETATLADIHREILDLERRATELQRQIRLRLPRSLFMPVERRDLLELLERQDRVAREARLIADCLFQHPPQIPAALREDLRALIQSSSAACQQATTIVDELDELIETGFRGPEASRVERMIDTLDQLGRDTDARCLDVGRALFDLEPELTPLDLVWLHQLIRSLGALAARATQVGDHLLPLIAR